MVAKKETVSLNWQSLFACIPLVDLWAAYRIEKLRWFFVMIWGPLLFNYYVVHPLIFVEYFEKFIESSECEPNWILYFLANSCDRIEMQVYDIVFTVSFVTLAVFLIRKWSRKWNKIISN